MSASGPSKTTSTTQQQATDYRVASDSGLAVGGQGNVANVEINNADADVAKQALAAAGTLGQGGFDLAKYLGSDAVDLGNGAFGLVKDVLSNQASQDTIRENTQATIWEQGLASQAGQLQAITALGATTATGGASDLNKTIQYAVIAIALAIAAVFIFKR